MGVTHAERCDGSKGPGSEREQCIAQLSCMFRVLPAQLPDWRLRWQNTATRTQKNLVTPAPGPACKRSTAARRGARWLASTHTMSPCRLSGAPAAWAIPLRPCFLGLPLLVATRLTPTQCLVGPLLNGVIPDTWPVIEMAGTPRTLPAKVAKVTAAAGRNTAPHSRIKALQTASNALPMVLRCRAPTQTCNAHACRHACTTHSLLTLLLPQTSPKGQAAAALAGHCDRVSTSRTTARTA